MAKETVKKEAAKKEAPVAAPEAEATEKKEPKDVHELLWVQ